MKWTKHNLSQVIWAWRRPDDRFQSRTFNVLLSPLLPLSPLSPLYSNRSRQMFSHSESEFFSPLSPSAAHVGMLGLFILNLKSSV